MLKSITTLTAIAAISLTGVASAATAKHHRAAAGHIHAPVLHHGGPIVTDVSAYSPGGKGSATEATCNLWNRQLQNDQQAVSQSEDDNDVQEYKDASKALNQDKSDALDAGCVVID